MAPAGSAQSRRPSLRRYSPARKAKLLRDSRSIGRFTSSYITIMIRNPDSARKEAPCLYTTWLVVGAGSTAAYYLSPLDKDPERTIVVIGEKDPWDKDPRIKS